MNKTLIINKLKNNNSMITKLEKLEQSYKYLYAKGFLRTKKEFAEKLEVNYNGLVSAFSGSSKHLTDNLLKKICVTYSDIFNKNYFLKDDKNMLLNEINDNNIPCKYENTPDDGLPLIPIEFMAGYGENNDGITLNDCERYNIPEFKNVGAEFLVRVGGNSMYPKYSSGDILACRKINNILFFQWGKIYVIDSSQGQMVKRICRHDNEDLVWLFSDNKEKYEPFAIPKNDIRSLSIVVGVLRLE